MSSKIISFRLSDTEAEILQSLQVDNEKSLSLTAARLLRGLLGTDSNKPVDNTGLQELVKQEVEKALANLSVNTYVDIQQIIEQELEKRLGELVA
jgi:curli biogenesis system outer membrane secretion channel CsgG